MVRKKHKKPKYEKYRSEDRRRKNKERKLEKLFRSIQRKNPDKKYVRKGNILMEVKDD